MRKVRRACAAGSWCQRLCPAGCCGSRAALATRSTKGQTLAVIQPAAPMPLDARTQMTGEARVRAADAAVSRANADRQRLAVELKQAEADAARAKALLDAGYGSRDDVRNRLSARVGSLREAAAAADVGDSRRRVRGRGGEGRADFAGRGGRRPRRHRHRADRRPVAEAHAGERSPWSRQARRSWRSARSTTSKSSTDYLSTDAVKIKPGAAVIIDRWGGAGHAGGTRPASRAGRLHEDLGAGRGRAARECRSSTSSIRGRSVRRLATASGSEVRVVIWEKRRRTHRPDQPACSGGKGSGRCS